MNFYNNSNTRFEDEEKPDELPENPMEKNDEQLAV